MTIARMLPMRLFKTIRMFVIVFALLMLYAVLPMPAHAAGLTDTQLQAVTNLLQSFNVDSNTINTVNRVLSAPVATPGGDGQGRWNTGGMGSSTICGIFNRTVGEGSTGDDVSALQAFLQKSGDLNLASTTGFFGPTTRAALQEWQARMGIATSGDPSTTGFGAFGPKTRALVNQHCGDTIGGNPNPHPMASSTGPRPTPINSANNAPASLPNPRTGANGNPLPSCTLRADKDSIQPGDSVTLTWESKNATSVSSATGDTTALSGTTIVTPTQSTVYIKKVHGPGGDNQCAQLIIVGGTTRAATPQIVEQPNTVNLASVASSVGAGVGVVLDAYLSLFNWQH